MPGQSVDTFLPKINLCVLTTIMSEIQSCFDQSDSTSSTDEDGFGPSNSKQIKLASDESGRALSTRVTHAPTLQRLLTSPTLNDSLDNTITISSTQLQLPANAMIITVDSLNSQVFQLIPHLSVDNDLAAIEYSQVGEDSEGATLIEVPPHIMMPPPAAPLMPHPPSTANNAPQWARLLQGCEKIGNYYRGYVWTDAELEHVLSLHKQCTRSVWGIRQSPSPAKPSTRLMWKSQYVPFDGIPFVNSGSRAVMYECQYGPRRRGTTKRLDDDQMCDAHMAHYTQTCPARIYIKRVRKFTSFTINTALDKKMMRFAMENVFKKLREDGLLQVGEERYYMQIPTEEAHDFHDPDETQVETLANTTKESSVLHPRIVEHLRELVAGGETRLYGIRKYLRWLVTHELFPSVGEGPERHNLTYFPTVNCLKNHIHQALKDIESGILPVTAPAVNIEIVSKVDESDKCVDNISNDTAESLDSQLDWSHIQPVTCDSVTPESMTVTLTRSHEDGETIVSQVETHHSDGTSTVSSMLNSHTAEILSRLPPDFFPVKSPFPLVDSSHEQDISDLHHISQGENIPSCSISLSSQIDSSSQLDSSSLMSFGAAVSVQL